MMRRRRRRGEESREKSGRWGWGGLEIVILHSATVLGERGGTWVSRRAESSKAASSTPTHCGYRRRRTPVARVVCTLQLAGGPSALAHRLRRYRIVTPLPAVRLGTPRSRSIPHCTFYSLQYCTCRRTGARVEPFARRPGPRGAGSVNLLMVASGAAAASQPVCTLRHSGPVVWSPRSSPSQAASKVPRTSLAGTTHTTRIHLEHP